jgi:hypothetical protein
MTFDEHESGNTEYDRIARIYRQLVISAIDSFNEWDGEPDATCDLPDDYLDEWVPKFVDAGFSEGFAIESLQDEILNIDY